MSKTIEIQNVPGTETWDVVVKVAGVERLRFGPVDDLVAAGLYAERNEGDEEVWGVWDTYFCPVADDYDVSEHLPAGTACVASPEMPADAPKGKIEQELETMAATLDAMGTQLAEIAAAQVRMEKRMAELSGECDDEVTRLPVVAVAHLADGTTREYRGTGKGNGTGPPAQGSGAASMTGLTGVTGEDLSDKTDPADQADLSDEQKGGPAL